MNFENSSKKPLFEQNENLSQRKTSISIFKSSRSSMRNPPSWISCLTFHLRTQFKRSTLLPTLSLPSALRWFGKVRLDRSCCLSTSSLSALRNPRLWDQLSQSSQSYWHQSRVISALWIRYFRRRKRVLCLLRIASRTRFLWMLANSRREGEVLSLWVILLSSIRILKSRILWVFAPRRWIPAFRMKSKGLLLRRSISSIFSKKLNSRFHLSLNLINSRICVKEGYQKRGSQKVSLRPISLELWGIREKLFLKEKRIGPEQEN